MKREVLVRKLAEATVNKDAYRLTYFTENYVEHLSDQEKILLGEEVKVAAGKIMDEKAVEKVLKTSQAAQAILKIKEA